MRALVLVLIGALANPSAELAAARAVSAQRSPAVDASCWKVAPPIYWPSDRAMSSPLASGRAVVNARGMQIALEHVYLTVTDLDRTLAYYRAFFPEWVVRWEGKSSGGRWVHFGPPGDGQPGYLSLAEDPRAAAIQPYTTAGAQHVGFAHPDVNALVDGVRATAQPSDVVDDGAYRRAYFDDPDGIEIEFVQKLSGR